MSKDEFEKLKSGKTRMIMLFDNDLSAKTFDTGSPYVVIKINEVDPSLYGGGRKDV